jgi:uncharacterized protein
MADAQSLHPELTHEERRQLFRDGIELFNQRCFFACHEVLETVWRSTDPEPKDLFQGLIQIAVGFFHHLERRRPDVACRVLAKGRRRLTPLAPASHGLDLDRLLTEVLSWEAWLEVPTGPSPALPRLVVLDHDQLR